MYNMPPKKDLKCWTRTGTSGAYTTCIDAKTGQQARRKAPAKKAPAKPKAPYKDVDVKMLEKALAQAKLNAKARAMPVATKPPAKKRKLKIVG